jgi:hypothetical protein
MVHQGDSSSREGLALPGWLVGRSPKERAIEHSLDQTIDLPFGGETPLEDLIEYLKAATKSPELPDGLPFYAAQAELWGAEKTMQSPVTIDLKEVAIRTGLRLALRQLDLKFVVSDGLVQILYVGDRAIEESQGAFRRIGHCNLALLFGLVGGLIARAFHATSSRALPMVS